MIGEASRRNIAFENGADLVDCWREKTSRKKNPAFGRDSWKVFQNVADCSIQDLFPSDCVTRKQCTYTQMHIEMQCKGRSETYKQYAVSLHEYTKSMSISYAGK